MKDLIKLTIERSLSFMKGESKCPTCKGKDLNDFCIDCQYFNGIPKYEIVEHPEWDRLDVIRIAKERKTN